MLTLALLAASGPAGAQAVPGLAAIEPHVVQAGQTGEIILRGENLQGANGIYLAGGGGLTADIVIHATRIVGQPAPSDTAAREVHVRLSAAADAPRGVRELRVVTPLGVSRPLSLVVDEYPVVAESSDNNTPAKARKVQLPAIIAGSMRRSGQIDYYRFAAKKGQRLIFDVVASRIGSRLDSSLYLYNDKGRQVAHDEDTNDLDSFIDYEVPADGEYVLRINDLRFQGGGDFPYHIRSGEIPYVRSIFPLGGKRGGQVSIDLVGENLDRPRMDMVLRPEQPTGSMRIFASTPRGLTNPRSFDVGDLPETCEKEPNDQLAQANAISLPVAVNGRIDPSGDVDQFRFTVPTTQPVVVEALAARFGSNLDALLTLTDAAGNVLQRANDTPGLSGDARLEIRETDPKKEYVVRVTDLLGRGGADFPYRLRIAPTVPEAPDFELLFQGGEPRLTRGAHTRLWVQARRKGNFAGDINVTLEGLPPGVTATPLVIGGKDSGSGLLILTAAPDARPGFYPMKLVASARIGQTPIARSLPLRGSVEQPPGVLLSVLESSPFTVGRLGDDVFNDPKKTADEITAVTRDLESTAPDRLAAQEKWEKESLLNHIWQPLEIIATRTTDGTTLKLQPDGLILADGPIPARETYTLTARTRLKTITALKIEVIADEGKPCGRGSDGNFVISRFSATYFEEGKGVDLKPLELKDAKADFSQNDFPIANALSADIKPGTGWAIFPQVNQSHWATFQLQKPIANDAGATIEISLQQDWTGGKLSVRKFRLMASGAPNAPGQLSPSPAVLQAAGTPVSQRSAEQKQAIASHFRQNDPLFKPQRDRLALLRSGSAKFPPEIVGNSVANLIVNVDRHGYEGDITLNLEGYSSGFEPNEGTPANINKNLDVKPLVLHGKETLGFIEIGSSPRTERATRTVVVRADASIAGQPYTQYSNLITMTVKDPPPPPPAAGSTPPSKAGPAAPKPGP
ncbi:MAG: PPC domain-containing protein [Tepidisphaerales bacterium]